jgi:isocitrate dehydrogenase
MDVFVHWKGMDVQELGKLVSTITSNNLEINMITNRGIKVWPDGFKETFCTDHWRCRFKAKNGKKVEKSDLLSLLTEANRNGLDVIKTENLYTFNGKAGFSLGQGQ